MDEEDKKTDPKAEPTPEAPPAADNKAPEAPVDNKEATPVPPKDDMADWGEALSEQKTAEAKAPAAELDAWADALSEQKTEEAKPAASVTKDPLLGHKAKTLSGDYKRAELEKLSDTSTASPDDGHKLDVILDIPVTISMQVGKTDISIRNLMKLNQGSVVELDRFAGEALDVFVNGTLIAHGEVVVVNEKFGIRLTDVISAAERISKLG